jgi:hypothetical protein
MSGDEVGDMKEDPKYRYYLMDLGFLLREQALEAKARKDAAQDKDDRLFHAGVLLTYYGVISLMQQQATGFDIALEDLRLDGFLPDRDLL